MSEAGRIEDSSRALETLEFLIRVQSYQAWPTTLIIFITEVLREDRMTRVAKVTKMTKMTKR